MARPIWKGNITFGLVNVPITLYSGEVRSDLHFNLLDSRNRARVRYQRVNEATGEEVPWESIVKGYEYDKDAYVLLGDDEFRRAAPEMARTIEIEEFVRRDDVSPLYFEKPYYLVPGKSGEKGYVLLRQALKDTKRAAVARVVIHTRQYLSLLLVQYDALVLEILRYHQELRQPDDFEIPGDDLDKYRVTKRELQMAVQLVESMSGKWEPERYQDRYREALMGYIQEKVESGQLEQLPAAEESGAGTSQAPTINMMELLKQSLEKAAPRSGKKRRRASGGSQQRAG
jgi:DNA end-binding protein Ku